MTVLVSGKASVSAKALMATAVAGVSIESVIIGAAVGGCFLVLQGIVETFLGEYLREKRERERKDNRKKEGRDSKKMVRLGKRRRRDSVDSDSSAVTPEFTDRDNE